MSEQTAPLTELGNASHFFEVNVELFGGPIDLLLHLVKVNELPVERLSLAQVTGQYLHCLERMRQFDLEIAGEYLVIAATLVGIKASVLLHEPPEFVQDEEGNLVNPEAELLRRLREAEIYREGAASLSCREILGIDVFAPAPLLGDVEAPPVTYRNHDVLLLGQAFRKLLEREGSAAALMTISFNAVSIVDRMITVVGILRDRGGRVAFEDLVVDRTSRVEVISSFLALLELCKRQAIRVEQSECFTQIDICLVGDSLGLQMAIESEFDLPAAQAVAM